jgi:hypothetical protein
MWTYVLGPVQWLASVNTMMNLRILLKSSFFSSHNCSLLKNILCYGVTQNCWWCYRDVDGVVGWQWEPSVDAASELSWRITRCKPLLHVRVMRILYTGLTQPPQAVTGARSALRMELCPRIKCWVSPRESYCSSQRFVVCHLIARHNRLKYIKKQRIAGEYFQNTK